MPDADSSLPPSGPALNEADIIDLLAAHRGQLDVNYVRSEFASVANANDPRWQKLEAWLGAQPDRE